jgi:predicted RNA-binding Zn ribbon-like protein
MNPDAGATALVGGVLALDFANTIGDGNERLSDAGDLLDWALHAGLADPEATAVRRLELGGDGRRAEALLRRARQLRDVLRRLGTALARDEALPAGELETLRDAVSETAKSAQFSRNADGGYLMSFEKAPVETAILGPVVWSAVELLREAQFERVKQCPECGFLFFDRSKNNSRRWCDMATCGNRAKLRKFRGRRR